MGRQTRQRDELGRRSTKELDQRLHIADRGRGHQVRPRCHVLKPNLLRVARGPQQDAHAKPLRLCRHIRCPAPDRRMRTQRRGLLHIDAEMLQAVRPDRKPLRPRQRFQTLGARPHNGQIFREQACSALYQRSGQRRLPQTWVPKERHGLAIHGHHACTQWHDRLALVQQEAQRSRHEQRLQGSGQLLAMAPFGGWSDDNLFPPRNQNARFRKPHQHGTIRAHIEQRVRQLGIRQ